MSERKAVTKAIATRYARSDRATRVCQINGGSGLACG
jgi:hypothetical protein